MTLCSWLSSETLMRKCFGVSMIEEILLCLMRIIFSIAWVGTGRRLDGCPVFALSTSLLGWYLFFFFLIIYFGCIGSSLLRTGFLWLRRVGTTLHCSARASHCGGFSCCRARALGARASVVVARGLSSCGSRALEHGLSSCGAWA